MQKIKTELDASWQIQFLNDSTLFLPQGLNLGNNELKAFTRKDIYSKNYFGIVSCLAMTTNPESTSNGDTVVYTIGKPEKGKPEIRYVVGRGAYAYPNYKELGVSQGGKTEFQKEYALAYYASIILRNPATLGGIKKIISPVVISAPFDGIAEDLKLALKGKHQINLNGTRPITIEIPEVWVMKEGKASGKIIQAYENNPSGTVMIDLGNGDYQFSYTSPQKVHVGEGMFRGKGVRHKLFDKLTNCPAIMRAKKGEPATYLEIKNAVESGKLIVVTGPRAADQIDISEEYYKFLDEYVNEMMVDLENWVGAQARDKGMQRGARYYVIGGGAKLPGLAERLGEGFEIFSKPDPQYLEAFCLTFVAMQQAKPPAIKASKAVVGAQA